MILIINQIYFLGYALVQLPDLFLYLYGCLKSRISNASHMDNDAGTTQNNSIYDHSAIENSRYATRSLDVELRGPNGGKKLCQTNLTLEATDSNKPPLTAKDNIAEMKEVLDQILCWKNDVDESINNRLGLLEKKIFSTSHQNKGRLPKE